jgi:hypothetical protein
LQTKTRAREDEPKATLYSVRLLQISFHLIMSITHWRERSHFQISQGPNCNLRVTHTRLGRRKVTWRSQEQPWSFAQLCINPCRSLMRSTKAKASSQLRPPKNLPSYFHFCSSSVLLLKRLFSVVLRRQPFQ